MPSVIEPPSDAFASPRVKKLYIAAPRGSATPMTMSLFRSRRNLETPAIVPPVPIEQIKPSIRILPDLRTRRLVMCLAVVEIVPLVGEDDAVGLALAQLLGKAPADVLVKVWIAVGDRRHFDQFGPAETQRILLFLALGLRDHDHGAISAGVGDEREPDPGIAGGAFDHDAADP